jgi:peptide/nickel transport system substrate-binding protein
MEGAGIRHNGFTVDGLARMLREGKITRRGFLGRAVGLVGGVAAAEGLLAQVVAAQTTAKTTLVIAQSADLTKLDPHFSTSVHDISVSFNVFDKLINRHPDGKLYPELATEWKLLNPTTWQFKLRPGVKFHNGDPLTSADVKFSIERALDPNMKASQVRTIFTTVDRIEVPDPQTVNFLMKQPDPLLPARLAYYGGQIMPKAYAERVGPEEFNAKPIGSGPIKFVEWVKDDRATFDANRDYWGGKIDTDQVIYRPIPEVAPRIAALLRGEVDIITKIPPDHVDRVAKNPTTKVEGVLYAGLNGLYVASQRPPLDNIKVRQALSLAIDREEIVKEMWRGQGIVPNGPIAKGDNHYPAGFPPLKYDPDKAKQLLKEGNYKGDEVLLSSGQGFLANDRQMSEALLAMWSAVGIRARVEVLEQSVMMQRLRERSFGGLRWADPTSTLGDPDGMMWRHLMPGGINDYWFRHPRFDELGNAARFSVDESFRGRAYREMAQIVLEYVPFIPILQPIESYGLQKYVDWKPNPNQTLELRQFNFKFRRA